MIITSLEAHELRLHLERGRYFWIQAEGEGMAHLWAHVQPPEYVISFQDLEDGTSEISVVEGSEEAHPHLLQVLRHWTSFARREATSSFLLSVLDGISPEEIDALSTALQGIVPPPLDGPYPDCLPPYKELTEAERLFPLVGGGWIELRLQNDELRATMSIPNAGGGMSFGPLLQGYVRAVTGRTRDAGNWILEEPEDVDLRPHSDVSEPDPQTFAPEEADVTIFPVVPPEGE